MENLISKLTGGGSGNSGLYDEQGAQHQYNQVYNQPQQHQGSWTHEAIAGAAGFAAMQAYESHLRATGQQPTHETMKVGL